MAAACCAARHGRSGQRAQSYHRASTPPARATGPKQPTARGCAGIFVQAGVPVTGIARRWLGGSSADDKVGVSGWIPFVANNKIEVERQCQLRVRQCHPQGFINGRFVDTHKKQASACFWLKFVNLLFNRSTSRKRMLGVALSATTHAGYRVRPRLVLMRSPLNNGNTPDAVTRNACAQADECRLSGDLFYRSLFLQWARC